MRRRRRSEGQHARRRFVPGQGQGAAGRTRHADLGALGRPFYDGNLDGQLAAKAALASIPDWTAGERWNGIADKITPSGAFGVGSGKESGHCTFRAIREPSDPGYDRIRGIA